MVELHWTEVDGVTTVWAETSRPLSAGLLFRAGQVDETLATRGHTHLLEHLVMSSLASIPERREGAVAPAFTVFGTTDSPQEVAAFIMGVCRALQSLPGDRLENEKQILEAEGAAVDPYSIWGSLMVWRYGAAGYGLTGMHELGLRTATLPKLHALRRSRFTRENAILWLSGPPPADLRLDLPSGVKLPVPKFRPILPEFPAWFVDDRSGGVAASAVVPRASAATFLCSIAGRRLYQRLRIERAVSYGPSVTYEPLDVDCALLLLYADSAKERRSELSDAFSEVIEGLGHIDDEEVEIVRKEALDKWEGPLAPPIEDLAVAEAQRAAVDWLFGRNHKSTETLAAEARSVTAAEIAECGRRAQSDALFALPGEATLRPVMGNAAPPGVAQAVEGRLIPSIDAPVNGHLLIHGTDGVTLKQPNGSQLTVRYAELEAALSYEDGCTVLIGADALHLAIEPTLWRDGPRICQEIRERVPRHLLLDCGARAADAAPKRATNRLQRLRARLMPRAR